jgi:2-hydroxychromene-2-carboxylate isomerase
MTTIDYYFSLNSPWTYLGAARFAEIAAAHKVTVHVKPARFGAIFEQTGGLPLPKRAPARQAYRLQELARWREHRGLPIHIQPKGFPSEETAATRLVIATALQGHNALGFSLELGRALWERQESFIDSVAVTAAAERAGVDLAAVKAAAPDDATLDARWQKNTDDALAQGVFGAPSYVLPGGEFFWGQDRLEFLDHALAQRRIAAL